MDEQRAEFEAWASHFFTRGELDRNGINGARPDEYRVLHIERMWGAWQAATQRQQERIAELEADIAHKNAYAEQLGRLLFKAGAERQELEAQVQALSLDAFAKDASIGHLSRLVDAERTDAARYQWLRERDLETISHGGVFAGKTPDNVILNGEDLDAACDAAIARATHKEQT